MYEIIYEDVEPNEEYEKTIEQVLKECYKEEKLENSKLIITITLTTPSKIRKINNEYRQIDRATDVLSFPMFEKSELDKKIENNDYYFRYYQALCYKLKSFNTFIKMIKANLLTIKIVGRLARSGTQEGKQKNKNLAFYLSKDNINELFSLVKTIDTDKIQFRKNYFM